MQLNQPYSLFQQLHDEKKERERGKERKERKDKKYSLKLIIININQTHIRYYAQSFILQSR